MSIYDSGNYIHTHLHLLKKLPNITARDEIRIMDFQINAAAYGLGEGCNSTRLKNLTNEV